MELVSLLVAGRPKAWQAMGFTVAQGGIRAGGVTLRLQDEAGATGVVGWELSGVRSSELDGLPTSVVPAPAPGQPPEHANGALAIDHVVVSTPRLQRTLAALEAAGLEVRRRREVKTPQGTLHQAFLRLGGVILEVVSPPGAADAPAAFWGLVFIVADLDACSVALGERLGAIRDAVQPGRRIATVRREAGLGLPVALMAPDPRRRPGGV